jgi:glycogen debranching enzyme
VSGAPGVHPIAGGLRFSVLSQAADQLWLCLFDAEDGETRFPMARDEAGLWSVDMPDAKPGQRYGYRAAGRWAPEEGLWFDPAKLLVDPYATRLDRRFAYNSQLGAYGAETAGLVPRAIVDTPASNVMHVPSLYRHGGLIYEVNVRAFTMLHPDVPEDIRGTVAALAQPAIVEHLRRLHVSAIELMPIVAWIDERHLPQLGLRNAWGYNPVVPMALDPGLCPGSMAELRDTIAVLHAAGIGVLLDLVFNHTGESDVVGPILAMRGLDEGLYYARDDQGRLINDTGCGNTLDFARPEVRALTLATLRHFVCGAGVDGFRFDLAPVLARGPGFDSNAPIFAEIAADPLLADRVMIAEPWDIGPGGYQLGAFPEHWLEWNDRYRDDVRRFWRGDGRLGTLATRVAGSTEIFPKRPRGVSFLAAHDGFALSDVVCYASRHNHANGEDNRDGHADEVSWNHGRDGDTVDGAIAAARQADLRAMLATLFLSSGPIMLTAGDEFGRTQQGNNNAYAQDNALTWLDWSGRDQELEAFVAVLSAWRAERLDWFVRLPEPCRWLRVDGAELSVEDWASGAEAYVRYVSDDPQRPLTFAIDRAARRVLWG